MSGPETFALFSLTICAAIAMGFILRAGRVQARNRPLIPPEPTEYFRATINERRNPMIDSYAGAVRLQRATRAAEEELRGTGNWTAQDIDQLTRTIVAAWIGDDEPAMVSIPVMKLGDIKVDSDAERKARRLRAVNESRERLDLPPLVTLDPPAKKGDDQ